MKFECDVLRFFLAVLVKYIYITMFVFNSKSIRIERFVVSFGDESKQVHKEQWEKRTLVNQTPCGTFWKAFSDFSYFVFAICIMFINLATLLWGSSMCTVRSVLQKSKMYAYLC